MNFQAVLFDLDGTLLDTLGDIGASMNRVLEQDGLSTLTPTFYQHAVGDGMEMLVRRCLRAQGAPEEEVPRLLERMQEVYSEHLLDSTTLYPGIADLLDRLTELSIRMCILSNKPDAMTRKLTEALLDHWPFNPVFGARPDVARKPDPTAAQDIARAYGLPPKAFLYLGDTNTDMETAKQAGMFAVGVLWGFRSREELRESGARALLRNPVELLHLLHADPADAAED